MKIYVNTEFLEFFRTPIYCWKACQQMKKSHGNVYNTVQRYLGLDLLKINHFSRNRRILYVLSEKGKMFLEMFKND